MSSRKKRLAGVPLESETAPNTSFAAPYSSADKSTPQKRSVESTSSGMSAPARLVSLDAFRGFIMLMLAAHGFGIASLANAPEESPVWDLVNRPAFQWFAFHFEHPPWVSSFVPGTHDAAIGSPWWHWGVSFWDLIQPSFMFMVGVAVPYSLQRRNTQGESPFRRGLHALVRSIVLILMGVFLYSLWSPATNWIFPNVLAQIGLGYFFVYLCAGRKLWIPLTAFAFVLVGTWALMHFVPPPANYNPAEVNASVERGEVFAAPFAQWSKNGNAFSQFDVWFLNLFPRSEEAGPFTFNGGGYQTLNFIPSIATMLLGLFCGQILQSRIAPSRKLLSLIGLAIALLTLGVIAGATCCPVVKRIWTPGWVLFSGGYVVAMLAIFYTLFDLLPLQKLAFPLVVIGSNSLLVYFFGELLTGWFAENVKRHFGWIIEGTLGKIGELFKFFPNRDMLAGEMGSTLVTAFEPVINSTSAVIVIWLICYWLYRQRVFLKV
ncbi:acyltransferase family protein [Planctomicrobium sp. SH668]|uniref:acyltransferase family protein n=1 Tax=Planctomicrobium sp. SH668 TaxID=3448126 RepID=UPI003F5B2C47